MIGCDRAGDASVRTYRGKLTIEQIAQGIEMCLQNVEELVEDARALLQGNRLSRASFILLCADQELGKVYVLQLMAIDCPEDQARWRPWWNRFRGHEVKVTYANIFGITEPFDPRFSSIIDMIQEDWLASAGDLERLRQLCLYVDYSATENRWVSPREIGTGVVESLMQKVTQRLQRALEAKEVGLLSADSLRIQHEDLSGVLAEITRLEEAGTLNSVSVDDKLASAWRRLWRRLILEGVVTLSDDYLIMDIPWRQFIEEERQ